MIRNLHLTIYIVFSILLISLALTVNFQQSISGFVGDLAVYLCMGQSLSHDYDCEYTQKDLERIYEDWGIGPGGIFLKKVGNKLFYAKPIIYPLFAAVLVRFLDTNGFLLFNILCLLLMIIMAYSYLRCYNSAPFAMLFSMTFFVFQVGFIYSFTIVPEVFNMFLVLAGYYFWFFEEQLWQKTYAKQLKWLALLMKSPFKEMIAALFLGLATFSKLTNAILLLGPFFALILQLMKHNGKPLKATLIKKILFPLLIFTLVIIILFSIQYYFTGDFNPQGGYRKVFHYPAWPFNGPNRTFDNGGFPISPEKTIKLDENTSFVGSIISFVIQRAAMTNLRMLFYDIGYFFVGRVGGLLPFFPMTFIAFFVVFRERRLEQFAILLPVALTILLFLLVMPQNYVGGAAIGNRYFINTYPVFLFLFQRIEFRKTLLFPWIIGSLFLAPLFFNPFQANYQIGNFATNFPYTLLPLEESLIANFPTNVDPKLNYIPFSENPKVRYFPGSNQRHYNITFASHNTYGYEWAMEKEGFWVKGKSSLEFILRYQATKFNFTVTIQNGSVPNTISFKAENLKKEKHFYQPGEIRTFSYSMTKPFPYFGQSLMKCKVTSTNGFIPYFLSNYKNKDFRLLGCFISIKTSPIK